ncbi:MAG: right-handed parallel beta-helix repeat-containing protein [Nocardioidaceae bacterium]
MSYGWKRGLVALAGSGLLVAGMVAGAQGASASGPMTLYVSPDGASGHAGWSCESAQFNTIGSAIMAAGPGATVVVCRGTYDEAVVVPFPMVLRGNDGAIVNALDATDSQGVPAPGITVVSSDVVVRGLTVENSTGEGILVVSPAPGAVSDVTITHNTVRSNDLGGPTSGYFQCQPQGNVPGDCGEGLHLMGVSDSWVTHNNVHGNSGGILLTDETGPNHGNVVAHNWVHANQFDCGITLPSHVAGNGVYDNIVRHNLIVNNGLLGEGAGVLIAAAGPSMAAYDNVVTHNVIRGNNLSGVTIHAHAPGANISGNRIVHNRIGRNNIGGDPDAADFNTTGVLVFSAAVPVSVTIRHNVISHNHYGVWMGSNVTAPNVATSNRFFSVWQKVFVGP